jgi:DNA replication protein DnaC
VFAEKELTWLDRARKAHEAMLTPNEVPERYRQVAFIPAMPANVARAVSDYCIGFWDLAAKGIAPAFLGRAGSYKTYSASLIANHVRNKGLLNTAFVQCGPELQQLERRRFDAESDQRIEHLCAVPFVVLDDFTKARPGSWAVDMLDAIVERRYSTGLPTCFTGNCLITATDNSELLNHFGVGFARRFREMTTGFVAVVRPSKD